VRSREQGETLQSLFSERWLVLEHVGGEMPDLRAAALVTKGLHKAVMAGYDRIGQSGAIPTAVSGHRPDGGPLSEPHLGFAPMAFLGSRYADGTVFGFALIPPRSGNLVADTAFQRALREIMPWNDEANRRELTLKGDGFHLVFTLVGETPRRSLDPTPYIGRASTWATCTPIVLDRHLKETENEARQIEIAKLLGGGLFEYWFARTRNAWSPASIQPWRALRRPTRRGALRPGLAGVCRKALLVVS